MAIPSGPSAARPLPARKPGGRYEKPSERMGHLVGKIPPGKGFSPMVPILRGLC
jgi:hypothetical protein